jgi:hypothetical protein
VQCFLGELESSAPEVQFAVCARLLMALPTKLTATSAVKAVIGTRVDPHVAQRFEPPGADCLCPGISDLAVCLIIRGRDMEQVKLVTAIIGMMIASRGRGASSR